MAVDEKKLETIVSQQIQLAQSYDSKERQKPRDKALDYYFGNMDKHVPPEQNRSKVVSKDLSDTINWILPGVMRVFTASDRMAEAEPVGPEDAEFARAATDGINYVFWKDNKGYEVVYSATWNSLAFGNGVVKTYWEDEDEYKTSFHSGLTEEQLALLLEPDERGNEPEVIASTENLVTLPPGPDGGSEVVKLYDVKIKRLVSTGEMCVEAIAPEKFLIDANATTTEDAAFCAHWEQKTRSELVEMGYDKKVVAEIPVAVAGDTAEEIARLNATEQDSADASMELVDYFECFMRIDVDEDGEAELLRVCSAGPGGVKTLDWEVWEDEHPFDDIPCRPVPHRWTAGSIADEVMDVQDIKTVLTRQALNNIYWSNNPQWFTKGNIKNMGELFNPTFGGAVQGDPSADVTPLVRPFVANHAFDAISYQDEVIAKRTGVSKTTMALDPETLQNQTATATQAQRDAGYSQIELIARNQAEWGWRKVFRKLLRLLIKHQDYARTVMWNGKPLVIDPRQWNADMDVTINVGLGTGSRDRDAQMLGMVLQQQIAFTDRIGAAFPEKALDMLPFIHNTLTKFAESTGLKNPEAYWPEINKDEIEAGKAELRNRQQQGDPKVALEAQKARADTELKQQQAQVDMHLQQQKTSADQQRMMQEMELRRYQIDSEIALKREQLSAELILKREQLAAELQLKRDIAEMSAAASVASNGAATSSVRVGGEPG